MRQVGQLVEHGLERDLVAVVGGGTGGHVAVGVHVHTGVVLPGVMSELEEEPPLSAAVAFAQRVAGVDVG